MHLLSLLLLVISRESFFGNPDCFLVLTLLALLHRMQTGTSPAQWHGKIQSLVQ